MTAGSRYPSKLGGLCTYFSLPFSAVRKKEISVFFTANILNALYNSNQTAICFM